MGKSREFYKPAEELYVKKGKTLEEIKTLLGISTTTLSKWKKDGRWDKKRKEYLVATRTGPAENLKEKVYKLLEEPGVDSKKADEIYKLLLTIEKLQGSFDLKGMTIEVMDRFTNYIRANEKDEGFVEKLQEHLHGFFNAMKGER